MEFLQLERLCCWFTPVSWPNFFWVLDHRDLVLTFCCRISQHSLEFIGRWMIAGHPGPKAPKQETRFCSLPRAPRVRWSSGAVCSVLFSQNLMPCPFTKKLNFCLHPSTDHCSSNAVKHVIVFIFELLISSHYLLTQMQEMPSDPAVSHNLSVTYLRTLHCALVLIFGGCPALERVATVPYFFHFRHCAWLWTYGGSSVHWATLNIIQKVMSPNTAEQKLTGTALTSFQEVIMLQVHILSFDDLDFTRYLFNKDV